MLPPSDSVIPHLITFLSQSNNVTFLSPSDNVIPHLITFSTWGFAIFFGLPGMMAIAYELQSRAEGKPIYASFILRFLGMFVSAKVFTLFIGLCIGSFFSGLSCLLYYVNNWKGFITISYWIEIIIIVVTIALLIVFLFRSRYIDISKIEEYIGEVST